MLALVARRIKVSCNLRNLHCRPSEQCQTINHNDNGSDNSKSVASTRVGGRCKWNLRGRNPNINIDGSDQYKKIVSHIRGDQCWWKSQNSGQLISIYSRYFSTSCEWNSLVPNPNKHGKDETKIVQLNGINGECDRKTSTQNQCILKQYTKKKKQKHCEFLIDHWNILKWTTGVLCSFYASKLMCLYARRRRNYRQWQQMERALAERQKIQKEVLDNHYGISKLQKSHVPTDKHDFSWSEIPASFSYQTIPITNDHDFKQNKVTISTQTTDSLHVKEPAHYDFNAANGEFKSTLAHWEFKLGNRSLKMNRPEVAVSHFIMASLHNHPEATYNLGVCYERGIGTSMNLKSAKECYRAAANLGHSKSMYNLAIFFAQGKGGLKKDRKAAGDLLRAASRLGCEEAKAALGIRIAIPNDASQILTDKSHQIITELNPVHRAGLSVVV